MAEDWHTIYTSPEFQKAFFLAQNLVAHCQEHNLPKNLIINGVIWNVRAYEAEAKLRLIKTILEN